MTKETGYVADKRTSETHRDQDIQKGAVEEGRRAVPEPHPPALDEDGLPGNMTAIAQDAIGANEDESQG